MIVKKKVEPGREDSVLFSFSLQIIRQFNQYDFLAGHITLPLNPAMVSENSF